MAEKRLDVGKFQAITIEDPVSVIIGQIRGLIADGTLEPGVSLPSERELADRLGVGRGHIRKALAKLEFYGIVKTVPSKGSVIASTGVNAIEGLVADILALDKPELASLLETRALLEVGAAGLAAERARPAGIKELKARFAAYSEKALRGVSAMEEDRLFHLKVAQLSGNSVLVSLVSLLAPGGVAVGRDLEGAGGGRLRCALGEHEAILRAIASGDAPAARRAMEEHLGKPGHRRLPDSGRGRR